MFVFLILFFAFVVAVQNILQPAGFALFAGAFYVSVIYGFVLLLAFMVASDGDDFPRYLAWKVSVVSKRSWWWYWKFHYRLPRYLTRAFRGANGELFVRMQVMRAAVAQGTPIEPKDVPPLRELIRAFRVKGKEIVKLVEYKELEKEMKAHTDSFAGFVVCSRTPEQAYIRYLTSVYLSFNAPERELIRASGQGGLWEWLDRYPTRSWLVKVLILLIIGLFLYGVLRIVFFPPLF